EGGRGRLSEHRRAAVPAGRDGPRVAAPVRGAGAGGACGGHRGAGAGRYRSGAAGAGRVRVRRRGGGDRGGGVGVGRAVAGARLGVAVGVRLGGAPRGGAGPAALIAGPNTGSPWPWRAWGCHGRRVLSLISDEEPARCRRRMRKRNGWSGPVVSGCSVTC